jgi:hypothetical protein
MEGGNGGRPVDPRPMVPIFDPAIVDWVASVLIGRSFRFHGRSIRPQFLLFTCAFFAMR